MRFEWDPDKAARNERVHGVSFEEASEVFATDAPVLEVYDVEHSETEDRFKSIGPIRRGFGTGSLDRANGRPCTNHQRVVGDEG
ncbi:MAG TPA: BrnT family toxin [Polyangiaceae bacterium]|nr:BrnT family toxin [Polyangiaceae bacterium]